MSSPTRPDFTVTVPVPLPAPCRREGGNWSPEPEWENYPADTQAFSSPWSIRIRRVGCSTEGV